jgi:hypothetical protein
MAVAAFSFSDYITMKGKAISITGRGGPEACETSRLLHFLDSRLIDAGEVVSLTHRPTVLYP